MGGNIFFSDPNTQPGVTGYKYYWLTMEQFENLKGIWPEVESDFRFSNPYGNDGKIYAREEDISETEQAIFTSYGALNYTYFNFSNLPGYSGG